MRVRWCSGCCPGWTGRTVGRSPSIVVMRHRMGCSTCCPRELGHRRRPRRPARLRRRRARRPGRDPGGRRNRGPEEGHRHGRGAAAVHRHRRPDRERAGRGLPGLRRPARARADRPGPDLPEVWTERPGPAATRPGSPTTSTFATKPRSATGCSPGPHWPPGCRALWVAGDEVYGADPNLRAAAAHLKFTGRRLRDARPPRIRAKFGYDYRFR